MLKYVLLAVAVFGASASALDTVQALEEARTIFTSSTGNVYLGLNDSTLLIGIIGLAVLGGILFVALQAFGADAFLPASNAYDKNSYDPYSTPEAQAALAYAQNQHQQHNQYRHKRSAVPYNLATKMHQLEEAQKKFA